MAEDRPVDSGAPKVDPAQRLLALYWEQFAEEQVSLEEFCRRAAAGELGDYTPDDLRAFLLAVESNILSNIQAMVEVNPELETLREERIAETQDMIADLIARYATAKSPSRDGADS